MDSRYSLDQFDFYLPPHAIAQEAVEPRDHARLLHVTHTNTHHHHVYDLPSLLRPTDILVLNNTRVIPARLYGLRGTVRVEVLLHKQNADGTWQAFARPGKRLKLGDSIVFAENFAAEILAKNEGGDIQLRFNGTPDEFLPLLIQHGEPPLPPYIHRDAGEAKQDSTRYQTVYAQHDGSVAAPTAGLHFTPELLEKLRQKGVTILFVTLHVGAGTFLPVKVADIREHKMHAEYGVVSDDVAAQINTAKQNGRRVVAVGTTSLRLLESATDEAGRIHPFSAETSIFITPGYKFRMVDALLTNFHLPKSTLFMLVSAFMGLERMKAAYQSALDNNYRFYSYGDTSLLERGSEIGAA